jgi:2-dehydropantoate 2-reductase
MRYCVVGAGAMGGLYGLRLAAKGHMVDFLDVDQTHVDAINRGGFRLSGVTGDNTYSVKATTDRGSLAGSADIVLFHPHTTGTVAAAETANVILKADGWAVTLQNGIGNVEALVEALGEARVVGGISYHSAALAGLAHSVHTNAGATYLGELGGGGGARVEGLAAALADAGFEPHVAPDIMSVIWSKFVHNCAINAICAVAGMRSGEVARLPAASELQTRILEEVMAVVDAKGITLTNPDPIGYIKAHTFLRFNKPSMQQHMEAARPTEIDSLNGALVREAQALGIPVPFNEALTMMVKAREWAVAEAASGVTRDFAAMEVEAEKEAATRGQSV